MVVPNVKLDDPIMYLDTRIQPQVQTCDTVVLQTCGAKVSDTTIYS